MKIKKITFLKFFIFLVCLPFLTNCANTPQSNNLNERNNMCDYLAGEINAITQSNNYNPRFYDNGGSPRLDNLRSQYNAYQCYSKAVTSTISINEGR